MSFEFSSSEQFLRETMSLSRHLKPMKVGPLRHAIAKNAGSNSVESYKSELDKQKKLVQQDIEYDWRRPPHDPHKFIQRKGLYLIFQTSFWRSRKDFTSVEEWHKEVRFSAFHSPELNGISEKIIQNEVYVSGYINLAKQDNFESIKNILDWFCTEECDTGCAREALFKKVFNGISDVFYEAAEVPLPTGNPLRAPALSDGLRDIFTSAGTQKGLPTRSDFREVVERLPEQFSDLIPLTNYDIAVAKTVFQCQSLTQALGELHERAMKVFQTVINEILSYHYCVGHPRTVKEFFFPVIEIFDDDGESGILRTAYYVNEAFRPDDSEGWPQIDLMDD
ncbi:MAG: hypothetical protein RI567_03510 [Marinobacter sp.]|nr:hypothetical protein [Marinobacter sp.]